MNTDALIYTDFDLNGQITAKAFTKCICRKPKGITSIDMKTILLTAFLLSALWGLKAQDIQKMEYNQEDKTALTAALENYYFRGIYEGSLDLLDQVYYSGALLFGDVKGQPYAKTRVQYLDGVRNRQSPRDSGKPFKGEIIAIQLVNTIAVAEVKVKMYDFNYHEFLAFHKLDSRWLIVNKMISDTGQ